MALPTPSQGLLHSLQTLASTCLDIAHTRLSLLALDLEEGRNQALILMAGALIALTLGGVALVLLTALLVMLTPEPQRLAVLGVFGLMYAVIALGLAWACLRHARAESTWFRGSLAELAKDRGERTP